MQQNHATSMPKHDSKHASKLLFMYFSCGFQFPCLAKAVILQPGPSEAQSAPSFQRFIQLRVPPGPVATRPPPTAEEWMPHMPRMIE